MEQRQEIHCPSCAPLDAGLNQAKRDPHRRYHAVLRLAMELERQGAVELLAGDCLLQDAEKVLGREEHYTVCHFLRCRSCGAVFFVGACIRGTPIYRQEREVSREKLSRLLWGRCGRLFAQPGGPLR